MAKIIEIGDLIERLTFQTDASVTVAVSSLTRSGTTATADTGAPHGFTSGDFVTIAGANQADYNGEVQVTVSDSDTFTYQVANSPVTPATGTITAAFKSDAQGGRGMGWRTTFTVWGKMEPLSTNESLQAQAINAITRYHAVIRHRPDVNAMMRIQWTPYLATTAKTLEISGEPTDHPDYPRVLMRVPCGERT